MTSSSFPKPPWTSLGKKLESLVRKALFEHALVEDQEHVAVALSGGKDSLTLLFLLHAISGRGIAPFKLSAIHVEGTVSCGAQVSRGYLASLCEQLKVPLICKQATSFGQEEIDCYSCARERRSILFSTAKEIGCKTIAFGHHRDDLAQTVLMNLLQKGEFAGLLPKVPMVCYGITIIRPLLYVQESEIIAFAKQYGFQRITCKCPHGQTSMRKKTQTLIEHLEEVYPLARLHLARAALAFGSTKALRPKKKLLRQLSEKEKEGEREDAEPILP